MQEEAGRHERVEMLLAVRRLRARTGQSAELQLGLGLPTGLLLHRLPQHGVRLLLLPGVASLGEGSAVVLR